MLKNFIASTFAGALLLVGCRTTPDATTPAIPPEVQAPKWLTNGLMAFYPLNGSAKDASGHGYNGTAHNATIVPDHLSNPDSAYRLNGAQGWPFGLALWPINKKILEHVVFDWSQMFQRKHVS